MVDLVSVFVEFRYVCGGNHGPYFLLFYSNSKENIQRAAALDVA